MRRGADAANLSALIERVKELELGAKVTDGMRLLIAALGARVDWQVFGQVPGEGDLVDGRASLRERVKSSLVLAGTNQRFLSTFPLRQHHLDWLDQRLGAGASELFGFLCLSKPIPIELLREWIGNALTESLLGIGLIISIDSSAWLAVRCIPFGKRFYLCDTRFVSQHGRAAGIPPAHISLQTHWVVDWLRRLVVARKDREPRVLEMGCGIGIGIIELAGHARLRIGAEVNTRNVAFARMNGVLASDAEAIFVESDLFSSVSGDFDVIFFAPWHPTADYLNVVVPFLEEAIGRLRQGGVLVLWAETRGVDDDHEPVLSAARALAERHQLNIDREIIWSYTSYDRLGQLELATVSSLAFHRARRRRRMRIRPTAAVVPWRLRQLLSIARSKHHS